MRDLDLDFDLDLVVVVVVVLLLLALRGVTILAVSFFCLDTACCTFETFGPAMCGHRYEVERDFKADF